MKTITVQIGNTDGKLTQDMWAAFVGQCDAAIQSEATIHFKGGPPVWERWQNVCWVILMHHEETLALKRKLTSIRAKFSQDSVAWTEGETEMI